MTQYENLIPSPAFVARRWNNAVITGLNGGQKSETFRTTALETSLVSLEIRPKWNFVDPTLSPRNFAFLKQIARIITVQLRDCLIIVIPALGGRLFFRNSRNSWNTKVERCKGANRWGEFRYLEMVGTIVGFLEILNGKKGSAFFPGKIFPGIPFKLI